jgi:hypothetical protein
VVVIISQKKRGVTLVVVGELLHQEKTFVLSNVCLFKPGVSINYLCGNRVRFVCEVRISISPSLLIVVVMSPSTHVTRRSVF